MRKTDVLVLGSMVGVFALLYGALWDGLTTMLISNFFYAMYGFNPADFPVLAYFNWNRMEFWLYCWNMTFGGNLAKGIVVNAFSCVCLTGYLYAKKDFPKKYIIPTLLGLTGMCMIFQSVEDWVGIILRGVVGFDLAKANLNIYGVLAPVMFAMPLVFLGVLYWIPFWAYILGHIGEGLFLVSLSFILNDLLEDGFKLTKKQKLNMIIIIISIILTMLPLGVIIK